MNTRNTHICSQCRSSFSESEVIYWEGTVVCSGCKAGFVQRLKEGVDDPEARPIFKLSPNWPYIFTCIAFAAPAGMGLNILVIIAYEYSVLGLTRTALNAGLALHAIVFALGAGAFMTTAYFWRWFYRKKVLYQWSIMVFAWLLVIGGSVICLSLSS